LISALILHLNEEVGHRVECRKHPSRTPSKISPSAPRKAHTPTPYQTSPPAPSLSWQTAGTHASSIDPLVATNIEPTTPFQGTRLNRMSACKRWEGGWSIFHTISLGHRHCFSGIKPLVHHLHHHQPDEEPSFRFG